MRRAALRGVLAGALLAAASGCAPSFNDSIPPPPPTRPGATTTTLADFSGVTMPAVAGRATTTLALGPGGATLNGTVVGPTGPVPGATVHAERLVGDFYTSGEVLSNADGTWTLPHVLGGRYRVRAWRSPDLALITPQVLFVGGAETKSLSLQLSQYQGIALTPAIAPDPPIVGQPANLAVSVTNATVDPKGIVRAQPLPAVQVQLSGGGQWVVGGANPAITGADGAATFPVMCEVPGAQTLTAIVNTAQSVALTVSACSLPPTTVPPTTAPGGPTTTVKTTTTAH